MSAKPTIAANPANEGEPEPLPIRRALISVSDKSGVVEFAQGLQALGVEIVSTGGTAAALSEAGIAVRTVEELTGAPEILGGRVKTLHPRLHAALLAVRDDPEHAATLEREGIETIDLVCTNLYPFERAVARRDATDAEVIENIDIGGPTMIRAAAKNHRYVAVVVRPESYDAVLAELEEGDGDDLGGNAALARQRGVRRHGPLRRRDQRLVRRALRGLPDPSDGLDGEVPRPLLRREPAPAGALYTEVGARAHVLSRVSKEHGKELSFNNVLDLDSARNLLADLDGPACVIVKHNNPCGAAEGETALDAYEKALVLRPGLGLRRRHRPEPADRRGAGERAARELRRGPDRARLRGRGDGDPPAEAGDPDPRGHRAAADRADLDMKRVRGGMLVQELDTAARDRDGMTVATGGEPSEQRVARRRSSPGRSASTSARTRSCSPRAGRRSGSAPGR